MKNLTRIGLIVIIVFSVYACTRYDYDQPDTFANQAGFKRHFGFPVPASVTDLYYFADELGADVKYQLGFVADHEAVEKIVTALNLVQREPDFSSSIAQEFDWWDADVIDGLTPYWKRSSDEDYYWLLWYDTGSQRVYYIEYSL